MSKQFFLLSIISLLIVAAVSSAVTAKITVGVKQGDWIEYRVTTLGNPPQEHNAVWGRMEIKAVDGPTLYLNVTTQFANGVFQYDDVNLDLEAGKLGDDFFIPANLKSGSVFFDSNVGNITIRKVEQRTYVGTERAVVSGSTARTTFYWDQSTGILVEAHSSYPDYNFTMDTVANNTNMWQPQILGLETAAFYATLTVTITVVVVVMVLFFRRKKTA